MTIPFTPDEENPFPEVGPMDGFLQGAAFSALNNRTQASITSMLQQQIQADSTWGGLWDLLIAALKELLDNAGELIQTIISGILYWLTHPGELLTGVIDFLKEVFSNTGELISTVINSLIYFFTHPGEPGGIGYLLMEALKALFTNVGPIIETIVDSLVYFFTHPGEIATKLLDGIKGLFAVGGDLVNTVLDTLVHWMGEAGSFLTALINAVITWLKTVGIDLTGPLSFMQIIVDNVAKFFGQTGETLFKWASNLVDITNLGTLIQGMFGSIFSIFPISMINTAEKVNLLNMGVFQTASTLEGANGWSWDSAKNRTGTIGGTAKANCAFDSSTKTLYSNQNIRVASGDRIAASAFVNTSSFNGAAGSIQLVLVRFAGVVKQSEEVLASRGASNNAWVELTNESSAYEITGSTTSVQLALRVTSSATAGSVWWDDITLWKTGLMKQGLVEYLISAWNGLIGGLSVGIGGTASPATAADPWNFTLQAGAGAKGQANNGVTNAGIAAGAAAVADGKAVTADGKAVGAQGTANTAVTNAATADGKAVTADGKAVGAQGTANTAVTNAGIADGKAVGINQALFGQNTPGSQVLLAKIPTDDIGRTINPGSGSGAQLSRVSTDPVAARAINARSFAPDGFFNQLTTASSDIQCLTTSGSVGTGNRNDYAGAFKVTLDGWYLVEIAYRVNVSFGDGGFVVAPVLYKGTSLASQSVYKIGTDCHFVWLLTTTSYQRYVQNSFIVYLTANQIVRAGTDIAYGGGNVAPPILGGQSGAGTSGAETYFSISLLNRSYA